MRNESSDDSELVMVITYCPYGDEKMCIFYPQNQKRQYICYNFFKGYAFDMSW